MWSIATLYPSMILLHGNFMKQTKYDKIFMDIWGFPKMVVPNNHGFSYWKWSFGGVLGVPPFKETPIYFTKPFLPNGQHPWRTSNPADAWFNETRKAAVAGADPKVQW